ncbi:MAG: glycoside hydrolase family 3 N-terminal domain-containing protein [Cyanobacteriota bacterium]|nr:glycoside hydrolase family 3 N-terminal domain-containing protein [Cyanobacteriota bacterium]MDY6358266.1 glycoside hydrolase family 3 N-terminal domain-containing protein [Cyanobacteriota bacterium]MDY6363793.1 glycoside hydrolase family 3 N-terminal domain-containing protein [Cyanobacteriota bacterium]MDY6382375.1 glycoside hydrolase family 3 N-terminal domain-containing protein [Cyanobacteriota bacterium]
MTDLKTKIYQMFILGTVGGNYKKALQCGLGGIIFFTQDIQSENQFKKLVKEIKSESLISPFLSIDQEGGRVERTEHIHNGKKYLSAKFAYEKGTDFLQKQTQEIANELKSYGINLNFAPCIDTNTNPANPIIAERAFSSNPEDVIKGEKIVSEVYKSNGIIPCVKHYPGHGDADSDSHKTLPEINLSMSEMEKYHIKPFKAAVQNGADMVMVAHLWCKCFDKDRLPASLSENALSYLRNNLGYNGVIISDDMIMKGVAEFGKTNACIKGIKAGLNMFIFRNSDDEIIDSIEQIYELAQSDKDLEDKINKSFDKIINLKKKYGIIS